MQFIGAIILTCNIALSKGIEMSTASQCVMLGTSSMPLTSKNKSVLLKVTVHFNVY